MYFSLHKEAIMDQINCSARNHNAFSTRTKENPIDHVNPNQTQWSQIKVPYIITEWQREFPPPPYFILRAHNIYKSTNSHFVLRMIKISRKEFKGCVDSDIPISSVCWLTDQPYWCKKLGYTFYCKNICSQLTRINVKHKQI